MKIWLYYEPIMELLVQNVIEKWRKLKEKDNIKEEENIKIIGKTLRSFFIDLLYASFKSES